MSDDTRGPNSPDAAREQARREIANNQNPSSTHGWHHVSQDAYNAERTRLEQERNKG